MTTYSVWSENDFIFSISSCFNREGGGGTEVVPLVPASLDQSGQCYLWFSTFFSSRRRGFPKIGFTGRPSTHVPYSGLSEPQCLKTATLGMRIGAPGKTDFGRSSSAG